MIINPYALGVSAPPRSQLNFAGADGSTTFTDENLSITWTAGDNAQIDTSLGDQRALFDGAGDYILAGNHVDLQLSGDFSIEFIQRYNSLSGYQTVVSRGYNVAGGWIIQTGNGDGKLSWYGWNAPSSLDSSAIETGGTINTGQDYAIRVERVGSAIKIYRDGVSVASGVSNPAQNFNATNDLVIGGGNFAGSPSGLSYNGWIKSWVMR